LTHPVGGLGNLRVGENSLILDSSCSLWSFLLSISQGYRLIILNKYKAID
jgi:hypothetical protein